MSHPVNDEILERLYEEELDNIHLCILKESEGDYKLSKEDREEMHKLASKRARKRFEELPEPLDLE
tara:strand:+ start:175 stop:372 length:198 start_codon:yes stop_codon:yes gene_type:complete